ncbi:phospholipase D-like domain-containing protein [Halomonas sp. NO4]|uniref:phospholipase D-like domain-containing protein n=1 Tax=Halomonas sp. NO4 TaxID=2484813 RepID=UPI001F091E1D|nr:phospholipase D-like domain-containing protein [Halomonas sp. NO4]
MSGLAGMLAGTLLSLALALYLATAWWHVRKPLPTGLGLTGPWREARDVQLRLDETWLDDAGQRHSRGQLLDERLALIAQARRLVVLDVFQFSDPADCPADCRPGIAAALCEALLARQRAVPDLRVVVITDPINSAYGGRATPHLDALRAAGIRVVETRLAATRDPNPSWNALWRLLFRWWGNAPHGWLPNPVGPGRVTLRSYLAALNLNTNHRKTLVVDHGNDWRALVGSANLDDTASAYREAGLVFSGPAALDLLASESGIAAFSGATALALPAAPPASDTAAESPSPALRVLGEGAIRHALLALIDDARPPERLDLEALYLAHRGVIRALLAAHRRGVAVRVLLDPSHEAFGLALHGVPNRPVAAELQRTGIPVRWCDTRGEQAHAKLLLRSGGTRPARLLLGSANFTRRSLDNLNLEANVELVADADHPAIRDALAAFSRHCHNAPRARFSVDYATYADASRRRYWLYRLMEATGWCTF